MKKIFILFPLLLSVIASAQNDSLYLSSEEIDSKIEIVTNDLINELDLRLDKIQLDNSVVNSMLLDSLKHQSEQLIDLNNKVDSQKNLSSNVLGQIDFLNDSIKFMKRQSRSADSLIKSLMTNEMNTISGGLLKLSDNVTNSRDMMDHTFDDLNQDISSKTIRGLISIIACMALAVGLFYAIRKRLTSSTAMLDGQIAETSSKLQTEQIKLDQKLIELYDSQLSSINLGVQSSDKSNDELDHTLALTVADEIIRMRNNISYMPEGTKGLKSLFKALQRIQDTFTVNGYEMIEMLNLPYNDGMKVVANFVPDPELKEGDQIISRIIKPQVNYNGLMVQAAEIEVSIGE
tara:strand:- start:640 stop:1680 length:1041 start_codon:yes stop_codon:yes gene_type:complete